jgi:hypothetical protein
MNGCPGVLSGRAENSTSDCSAPVLEKGKFGVGSVESIILAS